MLTFLPPAVMPVMPADGFLLSFTLPRANWANAVWAPPIPSSCANPNAPLQSLMTATRTTPVAATDDVTEIAAIAAASTPTGTRRRSARTLRRFIAVSPSLDSRNLCLLELRCCVAALHRADSDLLSGLLRQLAALASAAGCLGSRERARSQILSQIPTSPSGE